MLATNQSPATINPQTLEQIIAQENAAREAWEQTISHGGFRVSDLRQVFNAMTEGMPNWKMPFAVSTRGEGVLQAVAAIEYFVGATPRVSLNVETMRYLIETDGYYAATNGI